MSKDCFESAYKQYQQWSESLPAQTSTINHRLYLLELLEGSTKNPKLKENEKLVSALLKDSGIRSVGEKFERQGQDGMNKTWTVIWRKIGARYGIEMGLRAEDGELLSGEFFD